MKKILLFIFTFLLSIQAINAVAKPVKTKKSKPKKVIILKPKVTKKPVIVLRAIKPATPATPANPADTTPTPEDKKPAEPASQPETPSMSGKPADSSKKPEDESGNQAIPTDTQQPSTPVDTDSEITTTPEDKGPTESTPEPTQPAIPPSQPAQPVAPTQIDYCMDLKRRAQEIRSWIIQGIGENGDNCTIHLVAPPPDEVESVRVKKCCDPNKLKSEGFKILLQKTGGTGG